MAATAMPTGIGGGGRLLQRLDAPKRGGAAVNLTPLPAPGVRWHHKGAHRTARYADGKQNVIKCCRSVATAGACAILMAGELCWLQIVEVPIWLAPLVSAFHSAISWDILAWACLALAAPDFWQCPWIIFWAAISRYSPWHRAASLLYAAHIFCSRFGLQRSVSRHFLPKRWASTHPSVHAEALAVSDPRYQKEALNFDRGCVGWQHHYMFRLRIINVYSLCNEVLAQKHAEALGAMGAENGGVRMLYHGTSEANARMIAACGFKLPDSQGMFGKGVYFADTPLKSWQYARGKNWNSFSARGRTVGYLLVCAVALGRPKEMRRASNSLDPKKGDLMPKVPELDWRIRMSMNLAGASTLISAYRALMPRVLRASGVPDFDSVEAVPRSSGGAVIVPEFVIYHPERALPLFLLEVEQNNH